ncbi:hypothetical protein BDR07DRAFT_1476947 [Suillus spraguei]|nr:hypothetical protein BDR07DRAFT_1476947 [Suillus spraguei]
MEKHKLKVLCAAYKNKPNKFDNEPVELLNNTDLEEQNMFLDHCVPTKRMSSTSKTPPAVFAPKSFDEDHLSVNIIWTVSAPKPFTSVVVMPPCDDSEDDSVDHTANHCNKAMVNDTLPKVITAKCQLQQDSDEETKPSKSRKGSDSSCQHLKASDFEKIMQDLLGIATSIYCCLIVTQEHFPQTLISETMLAKEAWQEASKLAGLTTQFTPSLVKMMTRRTSQVCRELKTKMQALTASFFGFCTSCSTAAIKQNCDLAESLKDGTCSVFKDWEKRSRIYRTGLIQAAVNDMWFANRNDEGVIHSKYFDPLPLEILALILTLIECCIDEWMTGVKEYIKFSSATYTLVYLVHLSSLWRFDECTSTYNLLGKIGVNILNIAWLHAGVNPLVAHTTPVGFTDDVFDDAIEEYKAEAREE